MSACFCICVCNDLYHGGMVYITYAYTETSARVKIVDSKKITDTWANSSRGNR